MTENQQEIAADDPHSPDEKETRHRKKNAIISILILALLTLGLSGWYLLSKRASAPPEKSAEAKPSAAAAEKEKKEPATTTRVELSDEALKRAGVETAAVTSQAPAQSLMATGRLTFNEDAVVRIGSFVSGRITHIFSKVGDTVKKGQTVVHVHSHELTDARGAFSKAKATLAEKEKALAFAKIEAERNERLLTAKAISKREYDQAQAHVTAAKAEVEIGQAELNRASEFLEHLAFDQDSPDEIAIHSTLSGVVTKRLVTEGTVVNDATDLIEVANLSTLWAVAEVPEAQAAFVRIGQTAGIKVPALGDVTINGKVVHIGTMLNPETRTVQVRCLINNARGNLRPEMYATIQLQSAATAASLFIPRQAIQEINGEKVVFVPVENNAFEKRVIQVGREQGDLIEVVSGLQAGQQIVVKGGFFIKTEFLKSSLSEE